MAQPYGPSATWTWTASAESWEIRVDARNTGFSVVFGATQSLTYTVTIPPVSSVILTASPASPQTAGTRVTFSGAVGEGSGTYEYEFWGGPPAPPRGTLGQNYGVGNSLKWASTAGTYDVNVNARNVGSTAAYEATHTITYVVQ